MNFLLAANNYSDHSVPKRTGVWISNDEGASDSSRIETIFADVSLRRSHLLDNVTLIKKAGQMYVPFKRVALGMGFRISFDNASHSASGFLRSPNDWLVIDGINHRYKTRRSTKPFASSDLLTWENETYVSTKLLEQISRVKFSFDSESLDLAVEPDAPLSVTNLQLAYETHSPRQIGPDLGEMARRETPYKLATAPSVDLEFSGNAATGLRGTTPSASLAASGFGDLFYLGADYQVLTDTTGAPRLLAELGRTDDRNNLLGPLQASQYKFGSLNLPPVPLLVEDRAGLGATAGNFPLLNSFGLSTCTVRGTGPAGCAVELYSGDQLVATQAQCPTGHFDFPEVTLDEGPNHFRIVTISKSGDVHIENRMLYGTRTAPQSGKFQYRVSADRPEAALTGGNQFESANFANRFEAIAETKYGLAPGTWLTANAASVLDNYGNHAVLGLGAATWQSGVLWQADISSANTRTLSVGAGASFGVQNGTVNVEAVRSLAKSIPANSPLGLAAANSIRVDYEGFGGSAGARQNYGIGFEDAIEGGIPSSLISHWGIETRGYGVYEELVAPLTDGKPYGFAEIRAPYRNLHTKLDLTYDFASGSILRSGLLSASRELSPQYIASVDCTFSPYVHGQMEIGGTCYRVIGPFAAGLNLSMSGDGVRVGVLVSTAIAANNGRFNLAHPGIAEFGSVRIRTFLDKDGTGKFHPGNPGLANVAVRVTGKGEPVLSDKNGGCEIQNLAPDQAQPISLDEDSLSDPTWVAELPGVRIVPRSGRVSVVDLPVIATAEIDGKLLGKCPRDFQTWTALLHGTKANREYTSSFDDQEGFIFSRVRPGEYQLAVKDSKGHELSSRCVVVHSGVFTSGYDLEIGSSK